MHRPTIAARARPPASRRARPGSGDPAGIPADVEVDADGSGPEGRRGRKTHEDLRRRGDEASKFYTTSDAGKPPPSGEAEEPPHLRDDPGLACLTSQLGRIEMRIRHLDRFKRSVAAAEEECRRDLAASLAESVVTSRSTDDAGRSSGGNSQSDFSTTPATTEPWVKHWDPEVGAEYFYNNTTGEASWLDPRYGNIPA